MLSCREWVASEARHPSAARMAYRQLPKTINQLLVLHVKGWVFLPNGTDKFTPASASHLIPAQSLSVIAQRSSGFRLLRVLKGQALVGLLLRSQKHAPCQVKDSN